MVTELANHAVAAGRIDHVGGLFDVHAHRFLHEDVQSCGHGRHGLGIVVRGQDQDGVQCDRVEHVFHVGEGSGNPVAACQGLRRLDGQVAEGGDLELVGK